MSLFGQSLFKLKDDHDQINSILRQAFKNITVSAPTNNDERTSRKSYNARDLELVQLSDMIKLAQKQARIFKKPQIIAKMFFMLGKFNLAQYKEIKYTDYRSSFTEAQLDAFRSRTMTHYEQSLKKYQPEDPWIHWTNTHTRTLLSKKIKSPPCKAVDPRKLNFPKPAALTHRQGEPKVAERGRL